MLGRNRLTWSLMLSIPLFMTACAGAPRARPLPTAPVDEGPGSIAAVRKQFEGKWLLMSMTVSSKDGRKENIDATGELAFDDFGNLQVEYRITDSGMTALKTLGVAPAGQVIGTKGNVIIDPSTSRITYTGDDFEGQLLGFSRELAAERANPFALERVRYYTFENAGELTLSSKYDDGHNASVTRWKKS
jgi:hypothetical protein